MLLVVFVYVIVAERNFSWGVLPDWLDSQFFAGEFSRDAQNILVLCFFKRKGGGEASLVTVIEFLYLETGKGIHAAENIRL